MNAYVKMSTGFGRQIASGLLLLTFVFSLMTAQASASTFDSARDCDSNAVMYCGAMSTEELKEKYDAKKSVRVIFSHFGITAEDVNAMKESAVAGKVYKDGRVTVDGKVVARNAVTAGRKNIGASDKVSKDGVTFYTRTPSVSFASNSLDAFVVLNDKGEFKHAVLASCGNPVKANNTVEPTEQPEEEPEEEPKEEQPEEEPEVEPKEEQPKDDVPKPTVLPVTGAASMAGLFLGSSALGTAAHSVITRRRK